MTALIIGLGNPGDEYATTRHNAGFMVADELATRAGAKFGVDKRSRALTASMRLGGPGADGIPIVVGKPMSYMNRSGGPTSTLAKYYGVAPTDIVVIHDDLDLPFGTIRLKRGGGSGGHNGLKDLAKALGGPDFIRVRVGIGRPPDRQDPADFVLRPFSAAERKELDLIVSEAADAVLDVLAVGLEAAQQKWHSPS
ncbi:MAG: aminoacyl-tRNA hydrolase [Actinomycetes bacterium]